MPTLLTQGAASARAYGFGASSAPPVYIEDVFSTYLYTGNGSTQTITNGIDLSGKGGAVWVKSRSSATDHRLFDTARGAGKGITPNSAEAESNYGANGISFNNNGFNLGTASGTNASSATYASWTFRKQAKFFDVVTYTGNGANRTIAHNLGAVPGCIMIKRTDTPADWAVYHNSLTYANGTGASGTTKAGENVLFLNTTNFASAISTYWNNTDATLTNFSLGTNVAVNANGGTYVAYLFANNAGGFGLTGTEDVITCGYYIGDGTTNYSKTINLGWEPQFVLVKRTSQVTDTTGWGIADNMRGFTVGSNTNWLLANTSDAESILGGEAIYITNTGFRVAYTTWNANTAGFIYIAIRRGPMKTPTTGTSVFSPVAYTGTLTSGNPQTTGFPVDLGLFANRAGVAYNFSATDRLRGGTQEMSTQQVTVESSSAFPRLDSNTQVYFSNGQTSNTANGSGTRILEAFRRAPGFFDVVCYTGTGANRTLTHNLGAVPELMIVKGRSGATAWQVYSSALANTEYLVLNTTAAKATGATRWNSTTPTSSVFSLGTATEVNTSAGTYVAYLFATVAGVSKVGSYTGTGTTNQINCGFTGGARFVLIKRTDSTGDWYVWDSARGIVAGNDPYLLLNSAAAEVTGTDYVDTYSAGFEISSTAPAAINANGGTFVYLAIS
jgi:hypothetical protein